MMFFIYAKAAAAGKDATERGKVVYVSYTKIFVSYWFQLCRCLTVQEAVRGVLGRGLQGHYTLFELKINTAEDKKTTQWHTK